MSGITERETEQRQINIGVNINDTYLPKEGDRLRRKLKYNFMNPYQKWRAKGLFPWKLVLQLIKIILVTAQLAMFGLARSSAVEFMEKNTIALNHLFMKDWTSGYETLPYPPSSGTYALYTKDQFYDHINFAMERFDAIEDAAIGTYAFAIHHERQYMRLCKNMYKEGKIDAENQTYIYNAEIITEIAWLTRKDHINDSKSVPQATLTSHITLLSTRLGNCFDMKPIVNASRDFIYDSKTYLKELNETINFDSIIGMKLHFQLKTVHLRGLSPTTRPDCYLFNITIEYDNKDHSGALALNLNLEKINLECDGHIQYKDNNMVIVVLQSLFDCIVIVISFFSAVLCFRSMYRRFKLQSETAAYFKTYLQKELSFNERLEFMDLWYVIIVINDILTIAGSISKLLLENKVLFDYEIGGLLLGTGSLLVWFGVLRYLTLFENYSILIFTLKKCIPYVLRFLVCVGVLYMGFAFCGWVVLGPYHIKFRTLSSSSECLFSLINGDDMFVTFAALKGDTSDYVWWYSRVYLYIFISLFIYVVLSLFIAIIMDAYDTIKFYEHGFPKLELYKFMEECHDAPSSPLYRSDGEKTVLRCCSKSGRKNSDCVDETTNLLV